MPRFESELAIFLLCCRHTLPQLLELEYRVRLEWMSGASCLKFVVTCMYLYLSPDSKMRRDSDGISVRGSLCFLLRNFWVEIYVAND